MKRWCIKLDTKNQVLAVEEGSNVYLGAQTKLYLRDAVFCTAADELGALAICYHMLEEFRLGHLKYLGGECYAYRMPRLP